LRSGIVSRIAVVSKKNFADLTGRPFKLVLRGRIVEGFVVRKGDRYFAYQNLCMHLPITLDLKDDDFFTHDKTHLQCHMHGAIYDIETGHCTDGPCQGANLVVLEVLEEESRLVITASDDIGKK
jgi:nitrite reductase/ring-hydroxylating ferredoxin subunit